MLSAVIPPTVNHPSCPRNLARAVARAGKPLLLLAVRPRPERTRAAFSGNTPEAAIARKAAWHGIPRSRASGAPGARTWNRRFPRRTNGRIARSGIAPHASGLLSQRRELTGAITLSGMGHPFEPDGVQWPVRTGSLARDHVAETLPPRDLRIESSPISPAAPEPAPSGQASAAANPPAPPAHRPRRSSRGGETPCSSSLDRAIRDDRV